MSPGARIAEAVRELGEPAVVAACASLLSGRTTWDRSPLTLTYLGGAHAARELAVGRMAERGQDYWPRVWAARAFLYCWGDEAEPAVLTGLADPAWRVREMSAKVAALREVGAAAEMLAGLVDDPVTRVRAAAVRALGAVGEHEHVDAVRRAGRDEETSVVVAAERAIDAIRRRLDLEL